MDCWPVASFFLICIYILPAQEKVNSTHSLAGWKNNSSEGLGFRTTIAGIIAILDYLTARVPLSFYQNNMEKTVF